MSVAYEIVLETTKNCQILSELLTIENKAIRNREMSIIADNIKIKDKLTSKIMGLLSRLKEMRETIRKEGGLKQYLAQLQESFDAYKTLARKNALLLKSAHESTAVFLDTVRQVVEASRPKASTYGKDGAMASKKEEQASLVRKTI
jgi:flagellar biosynthesis/type III secretory pathway chaperone